MGLPFSGRFFVFKNRQIFLLPSVWFVSSLSFWKRNADLIPKTRKTVLSKQVFVPKRGKKKCEHFFLFVNYLNQRNLPPATLVNYDSFQISCLRSCRGEMRLVRFRLQFPSSFLLKKVAGACCKPSVSKK